VGGPHPALAALLRLYATDAPEPEPAAFFRAVRAAQEEFWAAGGMDEHLRVLYSALAAPEPKVELKELLPGRALAIEDWMWHKLSTAFVQLGSADPALAAGSASADALGALQSLLHDSYGAEYFNANRQSPILFLSVLLYSQQFERALAFLAREADFAEEAVHMGIALAHEGLLSVADTAVAGAKLLLEGGSVPQLQLPGLLQSSLLRWAAEDGVGAMRYLWLLRSSGAVRDQIAAEVLIRCSQSGVLLQDLPFVDEHAKTRLMRTIAARLQSEHGLAAQAASLLYGARDFDALAELLCDEISAQLLGQRAGGDVGQLRTDAAAFLQQWSATDDPLAAVKAAPLMQLLKACEFIEGSTRWRDARASGSAQQAHKAALVALSELRLLPALPAEVEGAQEEFRLLPPSLQRIFPELLERAAEVVHAQYEHLRRSAVRAGELVPLRAQVEALVAFAHMSMWTSAEVLGQLQLPTHATQRLAGWLADMA
jgi:hypothetical protein